MSMVLDGPFTKNIDGEMLTKDAVTKKYSKLVYSIAKKHKKRAAFFGIGYEDVVSEGNYGLIKAYKGFKNELGFKFMTYSYSMIEGEIKKRIRDNNHGPKFSRRIKEWALLIELGSKPHEIAVKLNINIQDAKEVWACKHQSGTVSMDVNVNKNDQKDMTMKDLIPIDEDYTTIFVNEFLQLLKDKKLRYYEVVQYLLEGKNQSEIGEIVGVSQVQVSRYIKEIRTLYQSFCEEVM